MSQQEQALKLATEIGHHQVEVYCRGGLGKINLALKDFSNALSNAQLAVKIADEIKMKRAQAYWRTLLAQVYLYTGQLDEALNAVTAARSYQSEWVNYRTVAMQGLILAKLGQPQLASEAFEQAVGFAEQLLTKTPSYFDARYILGLATCGRAWLNSKDRDSLVAQSRDAYAEAYKNCKSRGVVKEALLLLEELLSLNGAGDLSAPRDLLKQLEAAPESPA
jgi:tetratricopeptide (TPR) repeat protein